MTEVIIWLVDCGDGECIEREQPSTAFKPMPAYGALNGSFTANPNLNKPEADGFMKLGDIAGDDRFKPSPGGDSLAGEDRPMNVWTNGSATSFEDQTTQDFDSNDVVIGVKETIDWTAANGGPGSSYLTAKAASTNNAYVDEDVDGFMKLGDIKGEFQTTDLRSDNRFVIEPVNLVQGLDTGGMNNAEAIGLDPSGVDVVNNLVSTIDPGGSPTVF